MDQAGGTNLSNHMTVSHDNGRTWSEGIDTGVAAQASNLTYPGGDTLRMIHCHREGETGLFVRIVDFANDRWKTIEELDIWSNAPASQVSRYQNMALNLNLWMRAWSLESVVPWPGPDLRIGNLIPRGARGWPGGEGLSDARPLSGHIDL